MNDIIAERIQELIQEINDLLEERENLSNQIKQIGENMLAKQGAIFELKRLLEFEQSIKREES